MSVNKSIAKKKIQFQTTPKHATPVQLKNKLFGRFRATDRMFANAYLGIDVAFDAVRYVYLHRLKDKFEIVSYGSEKLSDTDVGRSTAIRTAFNNLFNKRKFKATQVILSVYGPEISTRIISLPAMPEKKLKPAIEIQNKNDIAYFNENTVWDFDILSEEKIDGKNFYKIMVIVAQNEAIVEFLQILKKFNIKPSLIIPKPKSLEASYKLMMPEIGDDLIVDVGDDYTMLCYLHNGKVSYVRNVPIGELSIKRNLEREIRKNEKLVLKKLENMGKNPVLNENIKEKVRQLSLKSNPLLEQFVSEISKTLSYVQSEFGLSKIDHCLLSGNGALIEGFEKKLQDSVKSKVILFYPIFHPNYRISDYIGFVSAFGAGLYLSDKFNLIPSSFKESWRFNYFTKWAYFAGIALVLGLAAITVQDYFKVNSRKGILQKAEKQLRTLNSQFSDYEKLTQDLENQWVSYRKLVAEAGQDQVLVTSLKIVANSIPEGMVIKEFTFDQPDIKNPNSPVRNIKLKGETYKNHNLWNQMLPAFIEALKRSGYFEKVTPVEQEFSDEEKKGIFTIELIYNPGSKANETIKQ